MKTLINRTLKNCNCETRESNGERWIIGLIPYNSRSENLSTWSPNGEYEIIDNTAFNKTLADGSEVRALFSHDDNKVLGSTKSGTLVLEQSNEGLICKCKVPNTSWGNDAWEIISRGDVQTMSFGFQKYDTYNEGNVTHLRSVRLIEVSYAVSQPAYKETKSFTQLRSLIEEVIDQKSEEKLQISDNEIHDLINTLKRLLPNPEPAVEEDKTEEQSNDTQAENPTNTEKEKLEELATLCEIELNT